MPLHLPPKKKKRKKAESKVGFKCKVKLWVKEKEMILTAENKPEQTNFQEESCTELTIF